MYLIMSYISHIYKPAFKNYIVKRNDVYQCKGAVTATAHFLTEAYLTTLLKMILIMAGSPYARWKKRVQMLGRVLNPLPTQREYSGLLLGKNYVDKVFTFFDDNFAGVKPIPKSKCLISTFGTWRREISEGPRFDFAVRRNQSSD